MENKIHDQLTELEQELNELKSSIEYIDSVKESAKTNNEIAASIIKSIKNFQTEYEKLIKSNKELIEKVESIDFPSKLEEIENKISAISNNITKSTTTISTAINKSEENINEKIIESTSKLKTSIRQTGNSLEEAIKNSEKNIKTDITTSQKNTIASVNKTEQNIKTEIENSKEELKKTIYYATGLLVVIILIIFGAFKFLIN